MTQKIYAHTLPNSTDPDRWQLLTDHLKGVADLAADFAATFDSSNWTHNAALLHDLGKIDDRFQKKLFDANAIPFHKNVSGKVNHSNTGAAYAEKHLPRGVGRTLAYLVSGHHAGLPDYFTPNPRHASWSARQEEAKEDLAKIGDAAKGFVSELLDLKAPPSFVNSKNYHLWVRMLFSCLVDADWLDTERFMGRNRFAARPTFPTLATLLERFDARMMQFGTPVPGSLNAIRNEILTHCRTAALRTPGLFSLTVPTGGGKTLSAMAFALTHAIQYEKNRIIYVIPYTSIIEQTAKELRTIFGDENVLEHHCNVVREDNEEKDKDNMEKYSPMDLASENWDAPIIVTTNVQFFESLYAAKPRRCRKIHNIADSVVLIDEAQLIAPDYLVPCRDVVERLSESFKTTFVLCTATQTSAFAKAEEIIPEPKKYYNALKRTKIHFPASTQESTSWEELAEKLQQHEKVLCIVNTRVDCRRLYDLLYNLVPQGTVHLSALMCGTHRTEVISDIKKRLDESGPLRVISTQLVEAGVDMDFPAVYRALAGLDSIVQAAGRCNREGKLPIGNVHVFVPPKPAPKGLLRKGEDTTKSLIRQGKTDTDDPDLFAEYFEKFYCRLNDQKQNIIEELTPDNKHGAVMFRHVGDTFRLIDDGCTVPILVRYGEGKGLIETLERQGPSGDLMKKLQRFTVTLDRHRAAAFQQSGMVREITLYNGQCSVLVQNVESCYSQEVGLDITQTGLTVEELVI